MIHALAVLLAFEPDFHALTPPPLRKNERMKIERKVVAKLSDHKVVQLELDQVERNAIDAFVWTGRVKGDERSSAIVAVKDRAVVASIETEGARYAIEPSAKGAHHVTEVDPAALPLEADPRRAPHPRVILSAAKDLRVNEDSGSFIDVLVVYTDDLALSFGTAGAQAAVSSAIAATNVAFANSGVIPRVRLVGSAQVEFNETGSLSAALDALTELDNVIDHVHTLRDQLGADVVSMLTQFGDYCGIAWLTEGPLGADFEPYGFSVVRQICATGSLTFPHELGHNFGLDHDRYVSPGGTPSWPYAFGYVDTLGHFRDIMAYGSGCNGCSRIQYFSNPDLTYLGRPLGVHYLDPDAADNVRALNVNASIITNWRESVVQPAPSFTDDPLVAGTSVAKAIHITELRSAINTFRTSVSLAPFTEWSSVGSGTVIGAAHVTELRNALTPALAALSRTATYTDAMLTSIKAVHIQELRDYVK